MASRRRGPRGPRPGPDLPGSPPQPSRAALDGSERGRAPPGFGPAGDVGVGGHRRSSSGQGAGQRTRPGGKQARSGLAHPGTPGHVRSRSSFPVAAAAHADPLAGALDRAAPQVASGRAAIPPVDQHGRAGSGVHGPAERATCSSVPAGPEAAPLARRVRDRPGQLRVGRAWPSDLLRAPGRACWAAAGAAPSQVLLPATPDRPSVAGDHRLQGLRHPLGCVRFGQGARRSNPRLAVQADRLDTTARRLRFAGHREVRKRKLPHHCPAQGFPRPPCPAPGNHTRGGGRRHRASGPLGQRKRSDHGHQEHRQDHQDRRPAPAQRPAGRPPDHHPRAGHGQARAAPRASSTNLARHLRPRRPGLRRHPRGQRRAHGPPSAPTPSEDDLNEKAMQIHLQRIVGAFVSSAYGAAQFYGNKVSEARQPHHRPRPTTAATRTATGSPASRARPNAPGCSPPRWRLQSFALLATADGAVSRLRPHHRRNLESPTRRPSRPPPPSSAARPRPRWTPSEADQPRAGAARSPPPASPNRTGRNRTIGSIRWTLDDLATARARLADPTLPPDERARLEGVADLREELLADARALGFLLDGQP